MASEGDRATSAASKPGTVSDFIEAVGRIDSTGLRRAPVQTGGQSEPLGLSPQAGEGWKAARAEPPEDAIHESSSV